MRSPRDSSPERRWRANAVMRAQDCADPELGAILSRVVKRRVERANRGLATDVNVVATSGNVVTTAGNVVSVESAGPDIVLLKVARPAGLTFVPGQALKLALGSGRPRPYTIASPPSADLLEFCIERIAGGQLSPGLTSLRPGDRVQLAAAAKGALTLEPDASLHLMLATATGIAPFRSMLLHLFERPDPAKRVVLLHAASFGDRLPYREELLALAQQHPRILEYVPSVSRPADARNRGWSGRTGRVDELLQELLGAAPLGQRAQAYACGRAAMIDSVRGRLAPLSIPLKTEEFD